MSIVNTIQEIINKIKEIYNDQKIIFTADSRAKRRFFLLAFGGLFFLNYLMFCFHADKNVFSIFPEIPKLENIHSTTLYLPSPDGKTILKEERKAGFYSSDEKYATVLFKMVLKGSRFENTSMAVFSNFNVRKIWINRGTGECIIDVEPTVLDDSVVVTEGSEELFKKSLEKTLSENIPAIKKVLLLERGVPGKSLWEI